MEGRFLEMLYKSCVAIDSKSSTQVKWKYKQYQIYTGRCIRTDWPKQFAKMLKLQNIWQHAMTLKQNYVSMF